MRTAGASARIVFQGALAGLLVTGWLAAQDRGMTTEQTRALTDTVEMGHPAASRSAGFEEADDPMLAKHPVTPHEPSHAARKAADAAEHLSKKKKFDEAIAKYRGAVQLDPLYFEAWNNLALELEAAGQKEEAEQIYRRLMQSNPEHVLVFTNLAALLSGEKRYAEAEAVARQAMKLHNYSFKANLVLGSLLVSEGKWTDEAKDKLEYAQVRYPQAKEMLSKWPGKAAGN
ncbi:MAG: tetratricopeptide repeat protein [Bryobacteraceae bacterium]